MATLSEAEIAHIEQEEEQRILLEMQRETEGQGKIPARPPSFLTRHARGLRYAAEVLFGIGVGLAAMIGGFYFFTAFLHIQF